MLTEIKDLKNLQSLEALDTRRKLRQYVVETGYNISLAV
jgi:hypothetical protein